MALESGASGLLARFSGWSGGATIADARALLQRRVTLYLLVQFALAAAAYGQRLLRGTVYQGRGLGAAFASEPGELIGHGSFVLLFGIVWVYCRKRTLSQRVLHGLEATGTVLICVAYGMVVLTPLTMARIAAGSHVGWHLYLMVIITLVVRAALVPSSAARSAVIGALSLVPVVLTIHHASAGVARPPTEEVWSMGADPTYMAVGWGATFVVVTAVVSHSIYGLQAKVREAMQLGQYTLEEMVGEGGMGAVYRARHALLRRPTAIKLLSADKAGERAVERFEQEVQQTSRLTHPNTVAIYDYGHAEGGIFYYVMEYLDGFDLEQLVELDGAQPPGRVIRILEQAADALDEAHRAGLIHRDIKPGNILVTHRGGVPDLVKVVDFGLVQEMDTPPDSRMTAKNVVMGTPQYAAPEMLVQASEIDGRVDLYALGAVGYFLLTGTQVFPCASVMEVLSAQVREQPERPSERLGQPVPDDLEGLILQCLAKEPDRRPESAAAFRDALRSCESATAWTRERASAWWREHGTDVERVRAAHLPTVRASAASTALTVALTGRRHRQGAETGRRQGGA